MTLELDFAIVMAILTFLFGILIGRLTKRHKNMLMSEAAERSYSKGMVKIYGQQTSAAYKKQQAENLAEIIKEITGVDPSRPMPPDEE